jgi:hypothetical protein
MSFGEGWHNNHHAHPTSARHGLAWYEIDISWWEIRLLQAIGLATSVHCARLPNSGRLDDQSLGKLKSIVDKVSAVRALDEFPVMPPGATSPVRALVDCPTASP